jgi:hypothetical protein
MPATRIRPGAGHTRDNGSREPVRLRWEAGNESTAREAGHVIARGRVDGVG